MPRLVACYVAIVTCIIVADEISETDRAGRRGGQHGSRIVTTAGTFSFMTRPASGMANRAGNDELDLGSDGEDLDFLDEADELIQSETQESSEVTEATDCQTAQEISTVACEGGLSVMCDANMKAAASVCNVTRGDSDTEVGENPQQGKRVTK